MTPTLRRQRGAWPTFAWVFAFVSCLGLSLGAQQSPNPGETREWSQIVREHAEKRRLQTALAVTEERLARDADDLEAHGWRGRLLAWLGRWPEAESEYRFALDRAPNDVDLLCGLADVLLWQEKFALALETIERGRSLAPNQPEVLLRRARILHVLGRISEARQQYREVLSFDPEIREARTGLATTEPEGRHELRFGGDASIFNYTDPAEAESLFLNSRWSPRWSSTVGTNLYQRFGENAAKFTLGGSFRFTKRDWLTVIGSSARTNGAIPKREASFEYGHALQIPNRWIQGLEASYQQHWLWYDRTHVLVLSLTQLYYLPRNCLWSITITGARSGFNGAGIEWVPSGSARFEFPLHRQLAANLSFANGTENYAHVDQIGRFSGRTFGGGLRYRFTSRQDLSGYVSIQERSQGRTQNSYGLSYGYRF